MVKLYDVIGILKYAESKSGLKFLASTAPLLGLDTLMFKLLTFVVGFP